MIEVLEISVGLLTKELMSWLSGDSDVIRGEVGRGPVGPGFRAASEIGHDDGTEQEHGEKC